MNRFPAPLFGLLSRRSILMQALGVAALSAAPTAWAQQESFSAWVHHFRSAALAAGIQQSTFDNAFAGVTPIPRVIELDHQQPEVKRTFDDYIARIISPERIEKGREQFAANRDLLETIGSRYSVDPQFIVSLWGLESSFGVAPGKFPIIAALATLAYDGRREAFFKAELIAALKILDTGLFTAEELRGSWAGAMGQTQFMPSSFLKFAVDYSGSGRQDIWHDRGDVFASIANYLSKSGWTAGQGWGLKIAPPVGLPPDYAMTLSRYAAGAGERLISEWARLGITGLDGQSLPDIATPAGLVQPGGPGGPCLLVFPNYRVILRWNRSLYFATAASWLADAITS